jgi:hypothetical protein
MLQPLNTSDGSADYRKLLVYAHHGWGKTTQMKNYQKRYGPGFIISGESGLSSVKSAKIDYLPFTSWNGETDPSKNKYSFRDIVKWIASDDFKKRNYKWLGWDSLTEAADLCFAHCKVELEKKGSKNGFDLWSDYAAQLIGACKWVRDLPMHVVVTALAKENQNENGDPEFWPMVAGKQVQTQLPGIFDAVFCGVRKTTGDEKSGLRIERFIVTDEVRGWHGKVRDENRRLRNVERASDVTELFARMDMDDEEYAKWVASQVAPQAAA